MTHFLYKQNTWNNHVFERTQLNTKCFMMYYINHECMIYIPMHEYICVSMYIELWGLMFGVNV